MTGRARRREKVGLGYGHLNGWRVRFVLISVEHVSTEEISYDWTEFSRDPVRFAQGTIRGRLIDAEGKPIKSAWVGAIPAEGPVPISFPEMRTKEDGSYSLDVEPGNIWSWSTGDNPANAEVPVLDHVFFHQLKPRQKPHRLMLPTLRCSVEDIQVHRVLVPHFFDVHVRCTPAGGLLRLSDADGSRAYRWAARSNAHGLGGPSPATRFRRGRTTSAQGGHGQLAEQAMCPCGLAARL